MLPIHNGPIQKNQNWNQILRFIRKWWNLETTFSRGSMLLWLPGDMEPIKNVQKTNVFRSFWRRFWIFRGSPKIMKTCKKHVFFLRICSFPLFFKIHRCFIFFLEMLKALHRTRGGGYNSKFGDVTQRYMHLKKNLLLIK